MDLGSARSLDSPIALFHTCQDIVMDTKAEAADLIRLQEAIAEVRSDAGDIYRKSWLIVGHVDSNPLVIDVLSYVS